MKTITTATLCALLAAALPAGCDSQPFEGVRPIVEVSDQHADPPDRVVVDYALMPKDGWLVIRANRNGLPGDFLGHTALRDGPSSDTAVTLSRPAQDLEVLYAMLYEDAEPTGVFDPDLDPPVTTVEGHLVTGRFTVTVGDRPTPRLSVADQRLGDPTRLVIAEVTSDGPGWVVISTDVEDAPGEVVGQVWVPNRDSADVEVVLRTPVADRRLWAVLHQDAGVVKAFEWPGVDVPAVGADEQPIATSFEVTVPHEPYIEPYEDLWPWPLNSVGVREVASDGPGWLRIHEDADGAPGAVLGQRDVPHGVDSRWLQLDRDIQTQETLWAVLHLDQGAVGTFEEGTDPVAVDFASEEVIVPFAVRRAPVQVNVEDQEVATADLVHVGDTVSLGPGWLVVREDASGAPGAVLGQAPLWHGWNGGDHELQLSRAIVDGETLWAVVHADRGEEGTFEFPDGPDVELDGNDGAVAAASFVVSLPPPPPEPILTVNDQTLIPWHLVVAAEATLGGPGWVVIRADDVDAPGTPGEILGQAATLYGVNTDVAVTLSRDAVDGELLWAQLRHDDQNTGSFDPGQDPVVTRADESRVELTFTASLAPPPGLTASDQDAAPANQVIVAQAVAHAPGWLVVHQDQAGAPGPVIGYVPLAVGVHTAVAVALDRDVNDGELLHAALYVDAGEAGTLELGGADAPVLDDAEAPLVASFTATVPEVVVPALTVADQTPEPGDVVTAAGVTSDGPGWIVVFDDDAGAPGTVLGHAAVASGTSGAVTVTLSRAVVDGETLHAQLHVDADVVGTFEYPGVDVPVDDGGAPLGVAFTVREPPTLTVASQAPDPVDEVVVASVRSHGPGWLVIYEDAAGSPGASIGRVAVTDGTSADVAVTLDRDAVDAEVLHAALLVDAGAVGTFEPTGADVPALGAGGAPVTGSFTVTVTPAPVATITANAQTLADLSTLVTVAEASSVGPGWIAIHADSAGTPGAVLGVAPVPDGTSTAVQVELTQPAADGATLHAMMHVDGGTVGVWEPGAGDDPALDGGAAVSASFVVTVPADLPAVRLSLSTDASGWLVTAVAPALHQPTTAVLGATNATLTLQPGWRYQLVNASAEPLELITLGATSAEDVVLLSEAGGGSLEADVDVAWTNDGAGTLTFTTAATLTGLTGYRSATQPDLGRGAITAP